MGSRLKKQLKVLSQQAAGQHVHGPGCSHGHKPSPNEFKDMLVNDENYDDEGRIYKDESGDLRDKDDESFTLPKITKERELLRRTMLGVVNKILRADNDEFPHAKVTYERLRSEGAGNLEARALLAGAWAEETFETVAKKTASTPERLASRLDKLHPTKR